MKHQVCQLSINFQRSKHEESLQRNFGTIPVTTANLTKRLLKAIIKSHLPKYVFRLETSVITHEVNEEDSGLAAWEAALAWVRRELDAKNEPLSL